MELIKAENIGKDYAVGEVTIKALDGVSFEIEPYSSQKNKYPDKISEGQKHPVSLSRALVTNLKLVSAEEQTASLDHTTAYMLLQLMKRMRDESKHSSLPCCAERVLWTR